MSLKFVIPPMKENPERPTRMYGYYSERTGLRTFYRRGDLKNSINHQFTGWEYTHPEEDKDKPYWNKRKRYIFNTDIFIIELVDGEWYTRHTLKKGDPTEPWFDYVEKVEYTTKYGRSHYVDISHFEYYNNQVNDGSDYYKSVKKVFRRPTESESREAYVQWRILVDREARVNKPFNEFVGSARANGNAEAVAKIW